MRHSWSVLLVAAVACGSSQKPSTPPPQLPPEKAEPATPTADQKPAEPAKPAEPPPGPVEMPVTTPTVQVKLVNPGKGKRVPLKLTPKQGDKQQIELALDFAGKQACATGSTCPPEVGPPQEDVAPTLVLTGESEVKAIDAKGAAQFELKVSKVETRQQANQQLKAEDVAKLIDLLKDLKLTGSVSSNGAASDMKLKLDSAPQVAQKALLLVSAEVIPVWPVLPAEPVGVGAKWQVTASQKLADRVDVTQTTDYELVKHEGSTWTIKGTTKVTGQNQTIEGNAKLTDIKGDGSVELALNDGALYPTGKTQVATNFKAELSLPDGKPFMIEFDLKQGAQVTPK